MKKITKVTLLSAILTFLKMCIGLLVSKVAAVYTGPAGFVLLGQIQNVIATFNGLANAAVGTGVIRHTAEHKKVGYEMCAPWWKAGFQWFIVIYSILLLATITFGDVIFLFLFGDEGDSSILLLAVLFLPFTAMGTFCNSVLNGLEQYKAFIYQGTISVIISGALIIGLIVYLGIEGALLAVALQYSLIGICFIIINWRKGWFKCHLLFSFKLTDEFKGMGSYVLMAVISAILTPLTLIVVRTMLIEHSGVEQAGNWQAVWKLSDVYLSVITIALSTYYVPKLAKTNNIETILLEANQTLKFVFPIVVIISMAVYFLREYLIWILFSEEFLEAEKLFFLQLCGNIVKICCWVYSYILLVKANLKVFILFEFAFSLLFIGLSYIFIPEMGANGVNLAYLLNYTICFSLLFFTMKYIKV